VPKARLDLPRDVGFDMRENPELLTAHSAHRSFVVALQTCIELLYCMCFNSLYRASRLAWWWYAEYLPSLWRLLGDGVCTCACVSVCVCVHVHVYCMCMCKYVYAYIVLYVSFFLVKFMTKSMVFEPGKRRIS
jgi:hypothetical protein